MKAMIDYNEDFMKNVEQVVIAAKLVALFDSKSARKQHLARLRREVKNLATKARVTQDEYFREWLKNIHERCGL